MKILFIISLLSTLCSCAPKPDNEISEMAERCFKNKQGIIIKFLPQHESSKEMEPEK